MYPITSTVKALYEAEQRQVLHITGTDKNGTAISITEANVMSDGSGFSIDRYSCIGEKIEIGTAVAAEMTLVLDNRQGQFDNVVFKGTELYVEIGIADWTQSNPTVYWMPCGYFTPDEQPRSSSVITIHALDRLANFDNMQPLTPWITSNGTNVTDSQGNTLYFISGAKYPCTVRDMIARLTNLYDIPFSQDLSGFPNYNYIISERPQLSQKVTSRNLLQWCAGLMGCNAYIDWTGTLRFAWYATDSGYEIEAANRFDGDFAESDFTVTGIRYTTSEDGDLIVGTEGFTIDLTGNYLLQENQTTALLNLRNALVGYSYRPFTATVVNAPYLWPMDLVTYTDKSGNSYTGTLTNVNFGMNSTTALASKGIGYSGDAPAGVTREQGKLIEQAMDATRKLDDSLNQENIFNRLTDNGQVQGMILYNGQIYINATYINTGILVADLVKAGILGDVAGKNYWNMQTGDFSLSATATVGGSTVDNIAQSKAQQAVDDLDNSLTQQDVFNRLTNNGAAQGVILRNGQLYINASYIQAGTLTLGGANNQNGTMRVLDASGNEIGKWNKDGITLYKGVIQGPSMVLGGLNNANGMLTVKDANGDPIGSWDEYGITIKDGSIAGPSITVGGSNDEDGTLEVKDSNGSAVVTLDSDGISAYEGIIGPFTIGSNGLSYNQLNATADIDYNGISFSQMLPTSGNPIEEVELNSTGLTFSFDSDSVVIRLINVIGGIGLAITFGGTDYLRFSTYNQSITANADVTINGDLNVNGDVNVQDGKTFTFNTADGFQVTVTNGIITGYSANATRSIVLGLQ